MCSRKDGPHQEICSGNRLFLFDDCIVASMRFLEYKNQDCTHSCTIELFRTLDEKVFQSTIYSKSIIAQR